MAHLQARERAVNAGLVLIGTATFALLAAVSGRIDVNGGRGWDGIPYAAMLERGWTAGSPNTALRPLIVALNEPLFRLSGDPLLAFEAMNYVYAAALVLAICVLFDRYSADRVAKTTLVTSVALCIATFKMSAYYPMLVDLGAHAVVTLAVYALVAGRRWMGALACIAAALAREFGAAAILFGIVRDLRTGVPALTTAATFGPSVAAWLGWRAVVSRAWSGRDDDLLSPAVLLGNAGHWEDPRFVAFFAYFLLTVFGGVSLLVWTHPGVVRRHLAAEPEWAAFAVWILVAAAVGGADIWRYVAYLLPVFVVLYAMVARSASPRTGRLLLASIVLVATWVTQRPHQPMDGEAYFRDWFPYYLVQRWAGDATWPPALWPLWLHRFLAAAALLLIVAVAVHAARFRRHKVW